jgi:hypothetical protein
MSGDADEDEERSLEYLHGLQDGLMVGKDIVKRWIEDKKDPEQLYLEFVYLMERLEEKKVVLVEASIA